MTISGPDLRRLRLYFGISTDVLTDGLCSESYLSLIENSKRPLTEPLSTAFLERINMFASEMKLDSWSDPLTSIKIQLASVYAEQNRNIEAARLGNELLVGMDRKTEVREVEESKIRGTTMNALLELGKHKEALELLNLKSEVGSQIARMYLSWSWANFHEAMNDNQSALESFEEALELSKREDQFEIYHQLKQAVLHTKLTLGAHLNTEDVTYLEKQRKRFLDNGGVDTFCLMSLTLALAAMTAKNFSAAEKFINEAVSLLGQMQIRNACTVAINAIDVLLACDNRTRALQCAVQAFELLRESQSFISTARMWRKLSINAQALNEPNLVQECLSQAQMIEFSLSHSAA
jgi:tetratricopeptide (TPR) repeat protein